MVKHAKEAETRARLVRPNHLMAVPPAVTSERPPETRAAAVPPGAIAPARRLRPIPLHFPVAADRARASRCPLARRRAGSTGTPRASGPRRDDSRGEFHRILRIPSNPRLDRALECVRAVGLESLRGAPGGFRPLNCSGWITSPAALSACDRPPTRGSTLLNVPTITLDASLLLKDRHRTFPV